MSSAPTPPQLSSPIVSAAIQKNSWWTQKSPVFLFFTVLLAVSALLAWGLQSVGKQVISSLEAQAALPAHNSSSQQSANSPAQTQAEALLQRVATGDSGAADEVLEQSDRWRGRTQRTTRTDQLLSISLNSSNMHTRQASLQAELAMDGVERSQAGLDRLEQALDDPSQRAWALWMLGALGNRGVNPDHVTGLIASYVTDSDVNTRAAAVDGLSLLATDGTLPILLDRFHNDPSPAVQERAACGLAQSGMYTHEQRITVASTLVNWLDDSQLSPQQRSWNLQALRDISGQNLGTNSSEWRSWLDAAH
jgi:HEAT repeat protein